MVRIGHYSQLKLELYISWQCSKIGLRICTVHWGPKSGKTLNCIPWPDHATGFILQMGKTTECAFCSNATVGGAIG